MASPILNLDHWISAAPFSVAPRKAQALLTLLKEKNVIFEFVDDNAGFVFESSSTSTDGIIRASATSLELLWCAAYCYWKIYQLILSIQRRGGVEWTLAETRERREIEELYRWALVNVQQEAAAPWPPNLPRPDEPLVFGSDLHVATELFLVAFGWILHHEVGHIVHGHAWLESERARPKREREWQADGKADAWLFNGVLEAEIRQKLALGVVTALAMLAARRPPGIDSSSSDKHPHPLERLVRSLASADTRPDDAAYAYGISAIQMNMLLTYVTYVPLSQTASFREQFEDLCSVVRSNNRSSLWAVLPTSDLRDYWIRRTSPLDHRTTQELAYSLWHDRGKPLWSAETDWYEAERILRERRIDPDLG